MKRSISRPARGVLAGCLAVAAVAAILVFAPGASAATAPCDVVARSEVGRLLGSTSTPTDVTVESLPGCRYGIAGGLTLDLLVRSDGSDGFALLRDLHAPRDRRVIDDYVDEATFGWGRGSTLDLIARRGDTVVLARLAGDDRSSGFTSTDPTRDAPNGDVAGTRVGSAMWALVTKAFAHVSDVDAPSADDLAGLWRTDDITPCAPASTASTRISRLSMADGSVEARKVTGDTCLDDRLTDFKGTVAGSGGSGLAYGLGTGSSAAGVPYRLTIRSPERIRLTGQSGTLRYTLDYERLSWPGLDEPSSVLLGIPSPSQALTAKNVALATVLSVLLFGLVFFPTTLFNSTLEANLEHYAAMVERLAGRFRRFRPPRRSAAAESLDATPTVPWWQRPAGVAVYLAGSGALYSLMQPGWGPNLATFITFVGFVASLVMSSVVSVAATRIYYGFRYRDGGGHPQIAGSTLAIAAASVAASRAVGFVPGYLYGVVVGWDPNHDGDEFDRGRVVAFNAALNVVAAVVMWLLIPVCRNLGSDDPNSLASIPLSVVAGVFVGSVHNLTIGLIPVEFLPGRILQRHRRTTWLALWATGGFLYSLVLLKPGLVTADSGSIVGTCLLAAVSSVVALTFWGYHRRRITTPAAAGVAVAAAEAAREPDARIPPP